jgi:hypothetical protein
MIPPQKGTAGVATVISSNKSVPVSLIPVQEFQMAGFD